MTGRRVRNGASIRGPHSALTDFLAANNISAAEIRDSYRQRAERAEQDAANDATTTGEGSAAQGQDVDEEQAQAESSTMAAERSKKRKRDQEEAIAKIKKGKEAKKKASKKKKRGSGDDSGSDYDLVEDMYKKAKKLPGQLENCELCDKRFTVTPYSKAGPEGGLLCTPCGKEIAKEAKANQKTAKPIVRKGRRKIESNRLDGLTQRGVRSLRQICINQLAKHAEDIEEFGEMPETMIDRLSEIFSKRRAMNSTTLKLFLQSDLDKLAIHEAAYLETEDFDQIFAVIPNIKKLVLRNCCQFKDKNIEYMIEKAKKLEEIELRGANLVSNDKWTELFIARGHDLKSFKVEWLDAAFDDQAVEALTTFCPNLERLKLERCKLLGVDTLDAVSRLEKLEHLSLRFSKDVPRDRLVLMVDQIGPNLRTLCLEHFVNNTFEESEEMGEYSDDAILETIHDTCVKLRKLRFTENYECSDQAYVNLFTSWSNPPLRYIDVNSTRDVDNASPEGPEDFPIGLASDGFQALMKHSGSQLQYLDISSCRHISKETFADIFNGEKQYPHLQEINLSFCPVVDTEVVAGIFRSCPQIKKVVTFACFQVEDVVVPRGIVLIGAPKAQDAIEQFGETVFDFQKELKKEMERDMAIATGRVVPLMA